MKFAVSKSLWPLLLGIWLGVSEPSGYSQMTEKGEPQVSAERSLAPSTERVLARAESAALRRRYREAIRILRAALLEHPGETALQLELGRAYLAAGYDNKAQRLFDEILRKEPGNRWAQIELARALAYQQRYDQPDEFYRHLLATNPGDDSLYPLLLANITVGVGLATHPFNPHPKRLMLIHRRWPRFPTDSGGQAS